ncbi:MAG: hypothetical protein K6E94_02945 [Elusimicrobiaceae bacterium]|nr:hypothetical protein [Elusimicrobiaceae bacterium]
MEQAKNTKTKNGSKALKIFFMVFAVALLLQVILLCRERFTYAVDLIREDFKIAVVLKNASSAKAKSFSSKLYFLPDVADVKSLNEDDIKGYLKQGNSGLNLQAFLPQGALPYFYEVKLSREAFLNPNIWAEQNIKPMGEEVEVFFQERESVLALYLLGLIKTMDIALIAAAFALLALGFFIETKKIQVPSVERFYALGTSILAYAAALGFIYILLSYLKMLPLTPYEPFAINQIVCFVFCLLFGRSLAKWSKF